jgi:hypothetical protein
VGLNYQKHCFSLLKHIINHIGSIDVIQLDDGNLRVNLKREMTEREALLINHLIKEIYKHEL